jgi:hypothetical protein
VAGTVMPLNITTEDISTSVMIVRADMPQTLRIVECLQVLAETHDWQASLDPADLYLSVEQTLACVIKAATVAGPMSQGTYKELISVIVNGVAHLPVSGELVGARQAVGGENAGRGVEAQTSAAIQRSEDLKICYLFSAQE